MLVVSTREFRDHQKSYLDQLDSGVEILLQRGKKKTPIMLTLTAKAFSIGSGRY
jgi:hypothetical protein